MYHSPHENKFSSALEPPPICSSLLWYSKFHLNCNCTAQNVTGRCSWVSLDGLPERIYTATIIRFRYDTLK